MDKITDQILKIAQERVYYAINEDMARMSKNANSFSDHKDGSATEEYRHYCDQAYNILDKIKAEKPDQAEKAERKADYYCRKLAEYYNDYYRNEASCPSIMICGGSNFPVKKKERQNSRRETLYDTWKYLQGYLQKIENILTNEQPIKSGDSDAIEKLRDKISCLEEEHKIHMAANRYYKNMVRSKALTAWMKRKYLKLRFLSKGIQLSRRLSHTTKPQISGGTKRGLKN